MISLCQLQFSTPFLFGFKRGCKSWSLHFLAAVDLIYLHAYLKHICILLKTPERSLQRQRELRRDVVVLIVVVFFLIFFL